MMIKTKEASDAMRYHKLKDFLLKENILIFKKVEICDSEPFVMGNEFYGSTFEDAVDSL